MRVLPVLVKLCILHPLLTVALVRFHNVLDLLNIDAVALEDFVQSLYQVVQRFWLHHLGVLHLSAEEGVVVVVVVMGVLFQIVFLTERNNRSLLLRQLSASPPLFIVGRCNLGASWRRTVPSREEVEGCRTQSGPRAFLPPAQNGTLATRRRRRHRAPSMGRTLLRVLFGVL